ncbi:MAG: hypothetical protein FJ399_17520 [Verrucomicrobia bacterium]|nr:hypothetical protein [Verrucomicrobiota bacterium]
MKPTLVFVGFALLSGAVLVVPATVGAALPREPVTSLKGLDPVALSQGREEPGLPDLAVTRGRYRYLFGSAQNLATFNSDPDRYQIQLGGGCGRMGPTSGLGSPDRFWVHYGRIYIFASDQCRDAFKAAPDLHIESDEPAPTGSSAELQRGRELVERMLVGFGGAAKVDAIASLELKRVRPYQADGASREQATFSRILLPGGFRIDEVWHNGAVHDFVFSGAGFRVASDGAWPMEELVRREFIKAFRRHPLVLLKARSEPGFQAVAAGRSKVGGRAVEWLAIGLDGATTTLGIDAATGRVLSVRFRSRAPSAIGTVTRNFSDFREVDGITLPFAVATAYNDAPAGEPRVYAEVRVNPNFAPALFAAPE